MSDREILHFINSKKEEGMVKLVESYGKLIYGVIYKTLVNKAEESEVEFIFNDILFKLWNNLIYFDYTEGKLVNYIISVSKFTTIDYIRKNNKDLNNVSIEEELLGAEDKDILSDKERFLDLISPLNETDKVIFIRRFYFGDSVSNIAKALNVSAGSISNKILRGKKRLKEYISLN